MPTIQQFQDYFNSNKVLMGWNQLVSIDGSGASDLLGFNTTKVLRVSDYNIGVTQDGDAPDFVTGRQDRTAWRKGPIEAQGNLNFPFTLPETGDAATGLGLSLFKAGANLVSYPNETFTITSSAHPSIVGCKVNTVTIECQAKEEIKSNAEIWGIVGVEDLLEIHSYGDTERSDWGGSDDTYGAAEGGTPDGEETTSDQLSLEQIPMWDIVKITGAPSGMYVVGFSITIDNRLQRNYTMGTGESALEGSIDVQRSPFGLNATSISANQRLINGTITWQSDYEGYISQVIGVGIESLTITIGPEGEDQLILTLNDCMWNAQPPTLGVGERVTVQSNFTALGRNEAEFDALTLSGELAS